MKLQDLLMINANVFGVSQPKMRLVSNKAIEFPTIGDRLYNVFVYAEGLNQLEFIYQDENGLVQIQKLNFRDYLCLKDVIEFIKDYDKQSGFIISSVSSLDYSNNVVLPSRYLLIEYDLTKIMIL